MKQSECVLLLVAIIALAHSVTVSEADILYIVPSQNYPCPVDESTCLTLQQFAEDSSIYNSTNITLVLTNGKHDLSNRISISNITAFSMTSRDGAYDTTIIDCGEFANFTLSAIQSIHIHGLTFSGCGKNRVEFVQQLTLENCMFMGKTHSGTSLSITESHADITDTTFLLNIMGTYRNHFEFLPIHHGSTVGGAMIVTHSIVTVDDCLFKDNKASVGGAIFAELASNIMIKNSDFKSNEALGCDTGLCYGGALFLEDSSSMTVHNCNFENNTSDGDGGVAVVINASLFISQTYALVNTAFEYGGVIRADNGANIIIAESNFTLNKAKGGGVITAQRKSNVSIDHSEFSHNSGNDYGGGAVFASMQCSIIIQDSLFDSNSEADDYDGGVAHLEDNSFSIISRCNFIGNSAFYGGAFALTRSNININDSTFSSNAGYDGGVVHGILQSNVTFKNCMFEKNKAIHSGGVVTVISEGAININSCSFNKNSAKRGGAVTLRNSTVLVDNSTFTNNTAYIDGGIVASYIQCRVDIYNSKFENNSAVHDGGVVYLFNGSISVVDSCQFSRNRANYGGVLVSLRMSDIGIKNCTFISNSAKTDGATLYGYSQCAFSVNGSVFTDNHAGNNGGLHISENSSITINHCDFMDNSVGHNGGVMFGYDHSSLTIDNSTIMNNNAGGSGGVVYGREHTEITISNSTIDRSFAQNSGGGIATLSYSHLEIETSILTNNRADYGGFIRVYLGSTADISNCSFIENWSNLDGGVVTVYRNSAVHVESSRFEHNNASFGGVFSVFQSTVELTNATFLHNSGEFAGVIRLLEGSRVTAMGSNFSRNIADRGGVLYSEGGIIIVVNNNFESNTARLFGAVLYVDSNGNVTLNGNNFIGNSAEFYGGVISLFDDTFATLENCMFSKNTAPGLGGIIDVQRISISISNCMFDSESMGGVLSAINSTININSSAFTNNVAGESSGAMYVRSNSFVTVWNSNFKNNSATNENGGAMSVYGQTKVKIYDCIFEGNIARHDGGAVSVAMQSSLTIIECTFTRNRANSFGGAVAAELSSTIVIDNLLTSHTPQNQAFTEGRGTHILNNKAVSESGGGISLKSGSGLYFKDLTNISNNRAYKHGGAIHANNSSVIIGNSVYLERNLAQQGGGISLENSELYDITDEDNMFPDINFVLNEAEYGGALYVDDNSNEDACSSEGPSTSCFFGKAGKEFRVNFDKNHANKSGSDLFGGLLDRCLTNTSVVNDSSSELGKGAALFTQISNIDVIGSNLTSVSSEAVNLCFCDTNDRPDCSKTRSSMQVVKGDPFDVSVAAVDQIRNPVPATVTSRIQGQPLAENQTTQRISGKCSSIKYQVNFLDTTQDYTLTLYADGPCNDKGISTLEVLIQIKSCTCAPGFMPENDTIRCSCACDTRDSTFTSYVTECKPSTQSIIREGLFWITYLDNDVNDNTSRYFIAPYCPLDYCQPPNVPIQIDLSKGPDAQCMEYREGLLCGSCQPGYSLSLGSSKCLKCPNNWYGLCVGITVAAVLAGLLLVFLFLVLNITVGTGSFNSIIFYANIINANKSIYFSHSNLTFLPVFISWLNLDIGFDSCFFEGMDVYAKTWIQLAFPLYIIFLVVMIILLTRCSKRFTNLIGTRNPVATLATLILLSYTKLLQIIITSFSFVTLTYPNGTQNVYWLPDANFEFNDHQLMIAALVGLSMIILIVGLLYTLLLFSWQWLLHFSESKLCKWTQNQRLHGFMNTNHGPYTANHRYWIGMLLLVRVLIYLIAAFSASSEQPITLLSTVIVMSCLLFFKAILWSRVYRNKLVDVIETAIFFNITIFALITLYTFNIVGYREIKDLLRLQTATAYISVGVVLILVLVILIIHVYRYGSKKIYSCFSHHHSKLVQMMYDQQDRNEVDTNSLESSVNEFLDVVDSPRARYFSFVPFRKPSIPTTVVSGPQRKKSGYGRRKPSKDLTEKLNGENNIVLSERK